MSQEDDQDHEHGLENGEQVLAVDDEPLKKGKKKRDATALRKAPNAPKRFKSSYICFFMAKQTVIKEELGDHASVTAVSKRSAEMWKSLPAEDRAVWDEIAAKDKHRYMIEKAQYSGPWQVPWKRLRKDPSAPKRPMSAFLYFSQTKRSEIKTDNPDMKNTEVSRILGELWRNLSDEERAPHVERERQQREKYKIAIAAWREENEAKLVAERKFQVEQAELAAVKPEGQLPLNFPELFASQQEPKANPYAFPNYPMTPYQIPGPYHFPINGKQPIILGPNGTPYVNQPGMAAMMAAQALQVAPPMLTEGTGGNAKHNNKVDNSSVQA